MNDEDHEALGAMLHQGKVYAKLHETREEPIEQARRAREWQAENAQLRAELAALREALGKIKRMTSYAKEEDTRAGKDMLALIRAEAIEALGGENA